MVLWPLLLDVKLMDVNTKERIKMNMFQRFNNWLCSKIGHSFSDIEIIIFKIKTNEINNDMKATIKCNRCKQVFVHKDSQLAKINNG